MSGIITDLHPTGAEPEVFSEGLGYIRYFGVNTRFLWYRNTADSAGVIFKQPAFSLVLPTGALPAILRQISAYAIEHRLPVPDHIAP